MSTIFRCADKQACLMNNFGCVHAFPYLEARWQVHVPGPAKPPLTLHTEKGDVPEFNFQWNKEPSRSPGARPVAFPSRPPAAGTSAQCSEDSHCSGQSHHSTSRVCSSAGARPQGVCHCAPAQELLSSRFGKNREPGHTHWMWQN